MSGNGTMQTSTKVVCFKLYLTSYKLLFGRKTVHATSVFDSSFLPEGPKGCLGICR